MRSHEEIKKLIVGIAASNNNIRAVLLNGSRANANVPPDKYQDFDIVYVVTHLERFTADHSWTDVFGKRLIWQLPDEMVFDKAAQGETVAFHYLMLFEDGNRIDLTLFPVEKLKSHFHTDSLTVAWLDKDALFTHLALPGENDYLVQKPTEKAFLDTCNEFWWVCTYVAKGLLRNEITYAKEMLETVVRPMFMKVVAWHIGTRTAFAVSVGKGGKYMQKYLPEETFTQLLATYAGAQIQDNWAALFIMMDLFDTLAQSVALKCAFLYNEAEGTNVKTHIRQWYHE